MGPVTRQELARWYRVFSTRAQGTYSEFSRARRERQLDRKATRRLVPKAPRGRNCRQGNSREQRRNDYSSKGA